MTTTAAAARRGLQLPHSPKTMPFIKWQGKSELNTRTTVLETERFPFIFISLYIKLMFSTLFGATARNRTSATGIFSPLLYLLSYSGIYGTGYRNRTYAL